MSLPDLTRDQRLREAARVLRERAEATSWAPQCGGWWRPADTPRRRLPAVVAEADTNVAECHYPPNADYIATLHPGVGLALADWLDAQGRHVGSYYCDAQCEPDGCDETKAALRLADLILGGAA